MDDTIEKVAEALRSRHINGVSVADIGEANQMILDLIPLNSVIGIGDSTTMRQLGVLAALEARGTKILNAFVPRQAGVDIEEFCAWRERVNQEATRCDVFLTGTNALTLDGRLVNVDARGNRVAGMFWGHPLSVVVVGSNKIVQSLEEAFMRIRNFIAPTHFRVRSGEMGGRTRETPCVATGLCVDCRALDRGCNIFTIIEGKPRDVDLHVILVNQDLGLGWDPSWPKERIAKIREEYKKFVWIPV